MNRRATALTDAPAATTGDPTLTRAAVALAIAAIVQVIVMQAADAHGPVWTTQGALAAVTAVVAWRAGGSTPRNLAAFGALVVGAILVATCVAFGIANA
jgi:hypothetical protein